MLVGEEVLKLPSYIKYLQKGAGETAPLTVKANFEPSPHLLALQSSRRDLLSVRSKHGERQNLGALIFSRRYKRALDHQRRCRH